MLRKKTFARQKTNAGARWLASHSFASASLVLASLALIFSPGCYLDYPDHAGSAEVQGVVTLDGRPVNRAKVVFLPKRLKRPYRTRITPLAYGVTDASGNFILQYPLGSKQKKNKEIASGEYSVFISKTEVEKDEQGNELGQWNKGVLPDEVRGIPRFGASQEIIPSRYNRETTLRFKIIASPKILQPEFSLTSVDSHLIEEE